MSSPSPRSKAAKLFKLERSSSGVFRIPRRPSSSTIPNSEDAISQLSSDSESILSADTFNELSKNISATVKLKTTRSNSKSIHNHHHQQQQQQQPQFTRSSPLIDVIRSRPNLSYHGIFTGKSLSPVLQQRYINDSSDDDDDEESNGNKDHYQFLKLVSNFEIVEIIYIICQFLNTIASNSITLLKSSRYVSTEHDGKIHLHSVFYGFAIGVILMGLKPWLYTGLTYLATIAINATLCIVVVVSICVSITQTKNKKESTKVSSSQFPLLNPVSSSTTKKSNTREQQTTRIPLQPIYKTVNRSADSVMYNDEPIQRENNFDLEMEQEDEYDDEFEDDTKSLFSVLTHGNNNGFDSKHNYKTFIEQTKKIKMVT